MIAMILLQMFFSNAETVSSDPVADIIKADDEQNQIQDRISGSHTPQVKIVMDITRGVQITKIMVDGVQVGKAFKNSGANNKPMRGIHGKYCSFSTTGENIKPVRAERSHYSKEFSVPLANFVTVDYDRGIGSHEGNVGRTSHGCLRQTKAGAKALYDVVVKNSVMKKGSSMIESTNVTYDIIDNTPGRYPAECDCLENWMGDKTSDRHTRVCELAKKDPEFLKRQAAKAAKEEKKRLAAEAAAKKKADAEAFKKMTAEEKAKVKAEAEAQKKLAAEEAAKKKLAGEPEVKVAEPTTERNIADKPVVKKPVAKKKKATLSPQAEKAIKNGKGGLF